MTVMSNPDSDTPRPRKSVRLHSSKARRGKPARVGEAKVEVAHLGSSVAKVLRDRLGCGVVLIDGRRRVAGLNDRARRLLGLAPDQRTLPAFEALPAPIRAVVREAALAGRGPVERQVELKLADGRMSVLNLSAGQFGADRKTASVVLVLEDLATARELEGRLAQLDRLAHLGTLAAGMAHEIRNALTAGKTFVDLLLEKHPDAELGEVVRRELGRIDAIVGRMLRFSAPSRPAHGEVRLHEVLEQSLRLVQPQLKDKLVSLSRSFQAAPDLLRGDAGQLQQAFVNLFLNALEALRPNGTLSVATELVRPGKVPEQGRGSGEQGRLLVAIRDNGTGIAREHMGRLFEPFFTTKPKGTGLGLAVTQRIIREHQGDIRVESQPGQGTAFQVLLPASA